MDKLLEYIEKNKDNFLTTLIELLKIPSISAQSEHKEDTKHAAEWLEKKLAELKFDTKIYETKGHPIVYGEHIVDKTKPTILIYGHYDVQSPDPLEAWITPPFEPTIRDNNLYARGVADDKGQLFTHFCAIEAILNTKNNLNVNVKFLIEGEEEVGGPNLDSFVKENIELLRADICLISDSHSLSTTQPLIDYGLRGIVYLELTLSTMPRDVHSGLYGGNIPNAAMELVSILTKLKDETTQKILIPKFYDDVRTLSAEELDEFKRSPFTKETIISETKVKQLVGVDLDIKTPIERSGAQPTLDVNGMHSGYIGEGPKTIIPAKASCKISMRLVPNQTEDKIYLEVEKYLKEITPPYVDLKIKKLHGGNPILFNRDSAYFKKAEEALIMVFGNKPVYELLGGSIPVTAIFKELLGIDSILMGFGLPDDGLHSPNEKLNLAMFYNGIKTSTYFLESFS